VSVQIILGIAVVVATLLYLGLRWLSQSVHYRGTQFDNLPPLLQMLFRLDCGGILVIDHEGGPGFFQLAVTANAPDAKQIEFGLPRTEWTESSFDDIVDVARERGWDYVLESDEGEAQVRAFLRIRMRGSKNELESACMDVLRTVKERMRLPESQSYDVHATGRPCPHSYAETKSAVRQLLAERFRR